MQWKAIRKLYAAYQMSPLPVTLSDLKGHFLLFETFVTPYTSRNIACVNYNIVLEV